MTHLASWFQSPVRALAVAISLSVIASGCGGDDAGPAGAAKGATKPRVGATGKVDLDGKPLAAGNINFISKDTGNAAAAVVENGTYTYTEAEGPNPGENSVLITGKEKLDGPAVWTWSSKVEVPAGGLKDGNFAVVAAETKPAPKSNPDD
jgi:uncharacterized protein YaiE (UPF0345 family)